MPLMVSLARLLAEGLDFMCHYMVHKLPPVKKIAISNHIREVKMLQGFLEGSLPPDGRYFGSQVWVAPQAVEYRLMIENWAHSKWIRWPSIADP